MTSEEIAAKAGITSFEVNSLSWLTSWDSVPFGKIQSFMEACGVNLADRAVSRMQCAYIRRGASFKYLKRSPEWEHFYKPMILAYVRSRTGG